MVAYLLVVSQFIPILHKSTKKFGASFVLCAPGIWNEFLVNMASSAPSLSFFMGKVKAHLFEKAYLPKKFASTLILMLLCGADIACPWTDN